jgi:hypothetical protein
VQRREDDVHTGQHLPRPLRIEHDEAAARRVAGERKSRAGSVDRRQCAIGDGQLTGVVGAEHPRPVARDPDRDDLETLRIEVRQHAARRDAGDGVLAAAPTEHHGHANLGHGPRG